MNQAQKDKWLAALRSGKYPQCTNTLLLYAEDDEDRGQPIGYCCLGVAAEVLGLMHSDELVEDDSFMTEREQLQLAKFNDGGWDVESSRPTGGWAGHADFNTIADYIERYVEAP